MFKLTKSKIIAITLGLAISIPFVTNANKKNDLQIGEKEIVAPAFSQDIQTVKEKMLNALYNYETLEASFETQINGKVATENEILIDYKNNRALSTTKIDGVITEQYLIKNKKVTHYLAESNEYSIDKQISEKREKPTLFKYKTQDGKKAINTSINPLALPIGYAEYSLNSETAAIQLDEAINVNFIGEDKLLGREVYILEVEFPKVHDVFYVDKATGILLKHEMKTDNSTIVITTKKLKVNEDIPNSELKIDLKDAKKVDELF